MADLTEQEQKIRSGEAWAEFCDLMKKAGDVVLRDDLSPSLFDRAEGLRYLSRLMRAGLVSFAERQGPEHAVFRAMPDRVKMGLDNPDNLYLSASVNPRFDYRIRGNRGTIHYLSFAAQNQNFAAKDRISGGSGHINASELQTDADGNFEIIASTQEKRGNWLPMAEDTKQILVRQTFLDRATERAVDATIECIPRPDLPPPLDPSAVPGQLLGSAFYAMGCAQWFHDWVVEFRSLAPDNEFHLPSMEQHLRVGGDPNIRIWLGYWRLAPDQALVIEVEPPRCQYWNFQLGNVWAESLDYETRTTHINSGRAVVGADGTVRIVVAHEPTGHPNWIDPAGHEHGTMGWRWVLADDHPEPRTRVVPLDEARRVPAG